MKLDKKRLIIRAVLFAVFVFWVIVFPRILPYTYPDDQYYWTYIQDGWDIFFVILYPMAYLISGALCAWFRYKPVVLWMLPDILVGLPEFFDRADAASRFLWDTFWLNIVLHLLMWFIGMLLVYGIRRLIALIRFLYAYNREEYLTYKRREQK